MTAPLTLNGASTMALILIERNKIASNLDYVGYIPGLGSIAGVARLIAGIAMMIFYSWKAANTDGAEEKKNLYIWSNQAKHEAVRGLCEITWICNLMILCNASCADSRKNPDEKGDLTDAESVKYQSIKGVIPRESYAAYGNYFYKDNNNRSEALHYSWKSYDHNQVIWQSVLRHSVSDLAANKAYIGTQGIVIKEGYAITLPEPGSAIYTVQSQQ